VGSGDAHPIFLNLFERHPRAVITHLNLRPSSGLRFKTDSDLRSISVVGIFYQLDKRDMRALNKFFAEFCEQGAVNRESELSHLSQSIAPVQ